MTSEFLDLGARQHQCWGMPWGQLLSFQLVHAGCCDAAGIPTYLGLRWMGVVSCVIAVLAVPPLHWPPWGSMFLPARCGATEEDYYFREYTEAERAQGLHLVSSHFVCSAVLLHTE